MFQVEYIQQYASSTSCSMPPRALNQIINNIMGKSIKIGQNQVTKLAHSSLGVAERGQTL